MMSNAGRRQTLAILAGLVLLCLPSALWALQKSLVDSLSNLDSLSRLTTIERIFGPGGVKFRLRGSADLSAFVKDRASNNPLLPHKSRRSIGLHFDEAIKANLQASLGKNLNLSIGYNTSATLKQDQRSLKLTYQGREGDLVRLIEVGDLAFRPRNSLIKFGSNLFGLRTRLEYGGLQLDLIASHQRSRQRTLRTQVDGGGVQKSFELSASDFDRRRHYFLSNFFRQHYEEALAQLPQVRSPLQVHRLEVWVISRGTSSEGARQLLAFADLAEEVRIHNPHIHPLGASLPHNRANSLYERLSKIIEGQAKLSEGQLSDFAPGLDYERIEAARRLSPNEYTLNPSLGYISLRHRLEPNELLAVAYEYSYEDKLYQVGELSEGDQHLGPRPLIVKLLKGSDSRTNSPYWHYMMRNVYDLGAMGVEAEEIELSLLYRSSTSSLAQPYLPEEALAKTPLLSLVRLDYIGQQGSGRADGRFDAEEGVTLHAAWGLLYIPLLEPFGSSLTRVLGSESLGAKYAFPALYTGTPKDVAEQIERDRFVLSGRAKGRTSGVILLPPQARPGNVQVYASGIKLVEGSDYIIDYLSGQIEIINAQIKQRREAIEVSIDEEDQQQRSTILGADLNLQLGRPLSLGATLMHLKEQAPEGPIPLGSRPLSNTLWGLNLHYQDEAPWLKDALNWLPIARQTAPARVALSAEFARLVVGEGAGSESYIDDFDATTSGINLTHPSAWRLASKPYSKGTIPSTDEQLLSYNYDRAWLSWYSVDPLLGRSHGGPASSPILRDAEQLSNHYARPIEIRELFPLRERELSAPGYLSTLNLSYYPRERGPYNLSLERMQPDGLLSQAEQSWAGIMRRIDQSDFESSGVEYLEFWLMDPFVYNRESRGGVMLLHLGEMSEDVLRDGILSYENGFALEEDEGETSGEGSTPWGRKPSAQSQRGGFDRTPQIRSRQDVGLDGLTSAEEAIHPTYRSYIERLRTRLSPTTQERWRQEAHSPLRDPAGDDFAHYLSPRYDSLRTPILERYKYYNGTERNSPTRQDNQSLISSEEPDSEDITLDNTLNLRDRYYEYRVELRPELMQPKTGYIAGERETRVQLPNGTTTEVKWYLYRIPIRSYSTTIGGVEDFRSMRMLRLVLQGFEERQDLRLAEFRLVRSSWQVYERSLSGDPTPLSSRLEMYAVGLEEHFDRRPINYVLPPDQRRNIRAKMGQAVEQDEQALALRVKRLSGGETRAVYRHLNQDLRHYKYLELLSHAERLAGRSAGEEGDLELFVRLGADHQHNYYEYSIPLRFTPEGQYSSLSRSDREAVWPKENVLRIPLERLVALKGQSGQGLVSSDGEYSTPDTDRPNARIRLRGNPSLGLVRVIMIGLRNTSTQEIGAEVWVNSLSASGVKDAGGWAARANLSLGLSDLGLTMLKTELSKAGFGDLETNSSMGQSEDLQRIQSTTTLDLGKLFPAKAKLTIPLVYEIVSEHSRPQYDPRNSDRLLEKTLEAQANKAMRDSILTMNTTSLLKKNILINGARWGLSSSSPMPYDPANITLHYVSNHSSYRSPSIAREERSYWHMGTIYEYLPTFEGLRLFRSPSKGAFKDYLRQYRLKLWPERVYLSSQLERTFEERHLRGKTLQIKELPGSYSQSFLWRRSIIVSWRPVPHASAMISMNTHARIDEPEPEIDRHLHPAPDTYWREEVLKSIASMGTPIRYQQMSKFTYKLPLETLRPLRWITCDGSYTARYRWDRGAMLLSSRTELPNRLSNEGELRMHIKLNFASLYNLFPDLLALEGRANEEHKSNDTTKQLKLRERAKLLGLMLRELQLSYWSTRSSLLPSFGPHVGSWAGQASTPLGLAPGLGYALGFADATFFDKARQSGWLRLEADRAQPAVLTHYNRFYVNARLRPSHRLRIHLFGEHRHTHRSEYLYSQAGRLVQHTGEMMMTTIGLGGIFERPRGEKHYASPTYTHLMQLKQSIEARHKGGRNSRSMTLAPAFRAAYGLLTSGKGVELTALPSVLSMLPNWEISYSGIKRKRLWGIPIHDLVIRHGYKGVYQVNHYRVPVGERVGEPSVADYDVASVSLLEELSPLIGFELKFDKRTSLNSTWKRQRALTLDMNSMRMTEMHANEWGIAFDYATHDIGALWGKKSKPGEERGLKLSVKIGRKYSLGVLRDLNTGRSYAIDGNQEDTTRMGIELELHRYLNIKGFYEFTKYEPLVNTRMDLSKKFTRNTRAHSGYPLRMREYGVSLVFKLDI